jgi:hypothetical protein
MTMTGMDALNRSQSSAETEAGSIKSPVKECTAWIGVAARYDDPWATPVTGRQVRIKVEGGIVTDGPRTKGLPTFGKEDGQPHDDVRAELGCYLQNGVKRGSAVIELVPSGGDDPKNIEKQILSELATFETSMHGLLHPWLKEWSTSGWRSIPEARRRGRLRGLGAWWEGELDFWASVGTATKEVWAGIKSGASKVATWYEDLPLSEKIGWVISPQLMLGQKIAAWLSETAQTLWERREQLLNVFKAFLEGTAAAIEKALEALIDLPGELGELFKELVQHSAEWVQNMIEVARETDVFKRSAQTIMTVVMMMTPNFWYEGIGMVEGYLFPEVLITIILLVIGALCAAAGASALAGRIAGILSKLRKAIAAAGKTGEIIITLVGKVEELAKLIGKLSKALRKKIDEVIDGATERVNQIIRRSIRRKPKLLPDGRIEPYPGSKIPPNPIQNKGYKNRKGQTERPDYVTNSKGHTTHYDKDGFPIFKNEFDTEIADAHIGSKKETEHFKAANQKLAKAAREDPALAEKLGLKDLDSLEKSTKAPTGFTWHHHQDVGRMQLVPTEVHQGIPHTGGMSIWGGGY